jgi:hypothetical protein
VMRQEDSDSAFTITPGAWKGSEEPSLELASPQPWGSGAALLYRVLSIR